MQSMLHWTRDLRLPMPVQHTDIVQQSIDGEAVLFDRATRRTHRMNATALVIWNGCDGRRSTDDVARELVERFDVAYETALTDVEQVLAVFAQGGLVEAGCA